MEAKMMMLWLMLVAAHLWCSSMCSPFPTVLRSVVNGTAASTGKAARIFGANGLCLDVKGGEYRDFTPVILWVCKEEPEVNQMWTFESDGTIRSNNDWCLDYYTRSRTELDMVIIINCYSRDRRPLTWTMEDNYGPIVGNFIRKSNVLSAFSGKVGDDIHVTTNTFTTLETWYFGGFEWRGQGRIVGENNLCLQGYTSNVWVETCSPGSYNVGQRWNRYPDGTIRPSSSHRQDVCVGFNRLTDKRVAIGPCEWDRQWGYSAKRWLFKSGTILNEGDNLVMEVTASNGVIAAPSTGLANQKWEWRRVGDY